MDQLFDPKSLEILQRYLDATKILYGEHPSERLIDSLTRQQQALSELNDHLNQLLRDVPLVESGNAEEIAVQSVRCTMLVGVITQLRIRTQKLADAVEKVVKQTQ